MKYLIFFFGIITQYVQGQQLPANGLVAYYPFNGNDRDESGNGNHPVFNTATLADGYDGSPNGGYSFDGETEYMRIPNSKSINFSRDYSITMWVKTTGFYQGNCHGNRIIMKGDRDYQSGNYHIGYDDNAYHHYTYCVPQKPDKYHQQYNAMGSATYDQNTYVSLHKWVHIAYVSDGREARLYINGSLYAHGPVDAKRKTNSDELMIGRMRNPQYPYWFKGSLDEIRLYNRALSEEEIRLFCPPEKPAGDDKLEARYASVRKTFDVTVDSVTVNLSTKNKVAGDTVSIIYNGRVIKKGLRLSDEPFKLNLKIDSAKDNDLAIYTEKSGAAPVNTNVEVLFDDGVQSEFMVSSTAASNGAVRFRLKQ